MKWIQLGGKRDLRVRLEFKPEDFWIGAFIKRETDKLWRFYDLWVCVVPMFPIHFAWDVAPRGFKTADNEVKG